MSFRKDFEIKKKVVAEVQAWLDGYEMPVTITGVISALISLGYLSGKLTKRPPDGLRAGVLSGQVKPQAAGNANRSTATLPAKDIFYD